MTRFDIPETTKSLMSAAIRLGICDAADIAALGATHGVWWPSYHEEILEWAWVNRHTEKGRAAHSELVGILEAPAPEDTDSGNDESALDAYARIDAENNPSAVL